MRLIINPSSRSGRCRARHAYWLRELERRRVPFAVSETGGPGHALSLARQATEPLVVAVGGDGTINEVLDGVLQSTVRKTMGVLYAGTSPDFCRFNRIPADDPAAALDTLLRGHTRRIDAARITLPDAPAAHFACGCNVGLGARVAAFANRHRRHLGDAAGTGVGLLVAVAHQKRFTAHLTLNGEKMVIEAVNHILILKNPHIASGLRLNLPLAPDDGALAVLAVRGLSRLALLGLLPAFYTGEAANHPAVSAHRCQSVCIECEPRQAVEFDGDPRGYTPVCIEVAPCALRLVCEADHA